ncbi:MAG: FKBP-type peptidyl-prolyl cis-trans isomerase [Candidatus Aenigmatarchaeota archaeon]
MQTNDFVIVNFSGKIKETNFEFDKGENLPLVVGVNYTLKGVDKALATMNVGEKKTVEILPEDGFGKRDEKLLRLVPMSEFKKHNTEPFPGMVLDADNMRGKVISVSGGRVKVDFNHPLSGKTLIYDLEVKEKLEGTENKVKGLLRMYTGSDDKIKVIPKDKEIEIELPPLVNSLYKKKIADDVMRFIGFEKVKFVEVFEKPKPEAKE